MRLKRWSTVLAALVAVLSLAIAMFAIPASRAFATRSIIAAYFFAHGFRLQRADIEFGRGRFSARNIAIVESSGAPFLTATSLDVSYGAPDRAYGISQVAVERPRLVVRRERDGSYNINRLYSPSAANGGPLPQLNLTTLVRDGTLEVENPFAPWGPGHAFALDDLQLTGSIHIGAISRLSLRAVLASSGERHALRADGYENDVSRIAQASARIDGVPIAAPFNVIVSAPTFVVQSGRADAAIHAYAIGWSASQSPAWHVQGRMTTRGDRLRVLPLAVPVNLTRADLLLDDGLITIADASGAASGIPLNAAGDVELFPDQRLDVQIFAKGDLAKARRLLSVSAAQPLRGPLVLAARIGGSPSAPHVAFSFSCPRGIRYESLPVTALEGRGYFADQHLTLLNVRGAYDGATVYGDGDIDVSAAPSGQMIFSASAPADRVPGLGNLDVRSTVRGLVAINGPLSALDGGGFLDLSGPNGAARSSFWAGPQALALGPLLLTSRGGGFLLAHVTMTRDAAQGLDGGLVADRFPLHVDDRAVALPGIMARPIALPAVSGSIDGGAQLGGSLTQPAGALNLAVSDLRVAALSLGRLSAAAIGSAGQFSIRKLAATGKDLHFSATGNVAETPVAGSTQWLGAGHIRDASIVGVPVHNLVLLAGESRGRYRMYAANADVGSGQIVALGQLPIAGPGALVAFARRFDLSTLQRFALPVRGGTVNALASFRGTVAKPRADFAAALSDGAFNGYPMNADVQGTLERGVVHTDDSRVALGDSQVDVSGDVRGLSATMPASATLDLAGRLSGGDLAQLTSFAAPKNLPISGDISGDFRVLGSAFDPVVQGTVTSGAGTVHGVGYQELLAAFTATRGGVSVAGGRAQIGTSSVAFSGSLAPGAARVSIDSPRLDLSAFDDYFDGADVVDGIGPVKLALHSGGGSFGVNGSAKLSGVRFMETPVGDVAAHVSSSAANRVVADMRVRGPFGALAVNGASAFSPSSGMLPNYQTARYDVHGSLSNVDLGLVATYANVPVRVAGRLGATFAGSGAPSNLIGRAAFGVAHGMIRSIPVRQLAGALSATRRSISLDRLNAAVPGLTVAARGSFDRSGRISGQARLDASDLSVLARLFGYPNQLTGSAVATLDAGGTLRAPVATATLTSNGAATRGVQIASVNAVAGYRDNRVTIARASASLAAGGSLELAGSLPLRLMPFEIGPPSAPLSLNVSANSANLAALNPLLGNTATIAGTLNVRASARGTMAHPKLAGSAALRNGVVSGSLDRTPLRQITADATFANDRVTLTDFNARAGKGTIAANAAVRLGGGDPATMLQSTVANLQLHDAQFDVPKFVTGVANGTLNFASDKVDPSLSGTLAFSNTNIPFTSILALAAGGSGGLVKTEGPRIPGVPSPKPGHTIVYGGSIYGDNPGVLTWHPPQPKNQPKAATLPPVGLHLQIVAADNVRISGLVDVTAKGDVGVMGTAAAPVLNGVLDAVRGQVGAFGTTFRLLRGSAVFRPRNGLLPVINAKAYADLPQAFVTADVTGRVDHLDSELTSDPDMTRAQILATLLDIGQINQALNGGGIGQQTDAGRAAETFVDSTVSNMLAGQVSSALENTLHIEDVSLAFDTQGRPMLEVRKQFGPNVYSIFRTSMNGTPQQSYGVSYYGRRRLEVDILQTRPLGTGGNGTLLPITTIQLSLTFNHH